MHKRALHNIPRLMQHGTLIIRTLSNFAANPSPTQNLCPKSSASILEVVLVGAPWYGPTPMQQRSPNQVKLQMVNFISEEDETSPNLRNLKRWGGNKNSVDMRGVTERAGERESLGHKRANNN